MSGETYKQTIEFMHQRCEALQSKLEEVEAKYEVLKNNSKIV